MRGGLRSVDTGLVKTKETCGCGNAAIHNIFRQLLRSFAHLFVYFSSIFFFYIGGFREDRKYLLVVHVYTTNVRVCTKRNNANYIKKYGICRW